MKFSFQGRHHDFSVDMFLVSERVLEVGIANPHILLMEEILHQLIGSLSHLFTRFYTPQVVVWDFPSTVPSLLYMYTYVSIDIQRSLNRSLQVYQMSIVSSISDHLGMKRLHPCFFAFAQF